MQYVQPYVDRAGADLQSLVDSLHPSEAHFFDEDRYNESDIKKVLAAVSYGRDCGELFPHVVKNVATAHLELKKLTFKGTEDAYSKSIYADCKGELALLSINSFQKDLTDRSQLIRASALRALSSVKTMEIIQIVLKSIRTAVADSSAYVRKTATACIVKVFEVDRDQYVPLRDLTVKLFQDRNTSVVASSVATYHHLCIAKRPAAYFVDIMLRYAKLFLFDSREPHSQEQTADFASLVACLKGLLRAQSTAVVLSAAAALCYLSKSEEDVKAVIPALLRSVRTGSWDSMTVLFSGFLPILRTHPSLFRPYLSDFFVMQMDPNSIKLLKVEVLELLADAKNCGQILAELKQYAREKFPLHNTYAPLVGRSIRAISNVALGVDSKVVDGCLRDLVKMLDSKCETVSSEAVVALRTLLQQTNEADRSAAGGGSPRLRSGESADAVISQLARSLSDLTSPVARASVVWILGEYQAEVSRAYAPDAVRRLATSFPQEALEVKHQILTLAFKVWSYHLCGGGQTPGAAGPPFISAQDPGTRNPRPNDPATAGTCSTTSTSAEGEGDSSSCAASSSEPSPNVVEQHKRMVERLEKMLDYICALAAKDEESWDLRDMGRFVAALKRTVVEDQHLCAAGAAAGAPPPANFSTTLVHLFAKQPRVEPLLRAFLNAKMKKKGGVGVEAAARLSGSKGTADELQNVMQSIQYRTAAQDMQMSYKERKSWILYSLARILDGPFSSYQALPEFQLPTPDSVRDPPVEQVRQQQRKHEPTAISSTNKHGGSGFHFAQAQRVQQPSNIDKAVVPKIETVLDLESFYAAEEQVSVRSAELVKQQLKAKQAIAAQKKNPEFNRTVNADAPVEDLATFSLLPDNIGVGVGVGGLLPSTQQLPVPSGEATAGTTSQQFLPGSGHPLGLGGINSLPPPGGGPLLGGAQNGLVPAGALPLMPAAPVPGVGMPGGAQVVEGEDEESDEDDWDLIKKNAEK
eukprot:g14030.t1